MITIERLQQIKVMVAQPDVCQIILFQKYYNSIAIDLIKQQKLDTDPKSIQQTNFAGNLTRAGGATMFFIIYGKKKKKKKKIRFSKRSS